MVPDTERSMKTQQIDEIRYKPIGIIHSPFKEPSGTPIQSAGASGVEGRVELFPEYAKGLKDIEGFSHIILIYHFHLSGKVSLEVVPYMDNRLHGLFATRAPARPNPIGISIVKLLKVQGVMLYVRDVDIVDSTPLLDIKPYVPDFDLREAQIGWLAKELNKLGRTKDDGRFSR